MIPDKAAPVLEKYLPGLADKPAAYWVLLIAAVEDNDFRFTTALALTAHNLGRKAVASIGHDNVYAPLQGWTYASLNPGALYELGYQLESSISDPHPKYPGSSDFSSE